jgi:N-acetylmuramoyl-L-alanine amidase
LGAQSITKNAFRESNLKVLKNAPPETMAIVVELGFTSNRVNAERLQSAAYRDDIVAAISRAVEGVVMLKAARN